MDNSTEPRPGDEDFEGFRIRLPEDCVEYMLFIVGEKADGNLPSLETVRKAADRKLEELAKDYIWQREPFKVETEIQRGLGLPYLHGITHYGDNLEDEWLIVYLLRELTKSFANLWVRVSDSDGEFLLIEAAKVTPKWLNPENDSNRVWIHDGKLLIIPPSRSGAPETEIPQTSKPLTLREAIETLRSSPDSLIHSPSIEAEAFYRLEKYPGQIAASFHHSLVTLPRKLAYILHARPQAIAPATEAFYLRDPRSLKPLLSPAPSLTLTFPPTDLVTISVRFTKVLYAQLKSQHFSPPPAWRSLLHAAELEAATGSPASAQKLARLQLGMKLTTGFEILSRTAHTSPSRLVREVALLLDDLAEDGGDAALPTDEEMGSWPDVEREDDDSWMDIDYADFERELEGKRGGGGGRVSAGFGDAAAQADLQKIVDRFEAFLNDDEAGIDGAEVDEMDRDDDGDEEEDSDEDEGNEVSFDEEQFARMMREMMGLPSGDVGEEKGKQKAAQEQDDDEDEEIREIMEQIESELKGHGVLELDPKPKAKPSIKEQGEGEQTSGPVESREKTEDESGDEEVDIDYNLAKNLLESFKGQAGMPGPAGNLLGLMGMTLPRDEEDSDDEQT
ncbi:hypothetical protein VTK56DRAFT_5618 [Thermocarpiscus australiensis]